MRFVCFSFDALECGFQKNRYAEAKHTCSFVLFFVRFVEREKERVFHPFIGDCGVRTVSWDYRDVSVEDHKLFKYAFHKGVIVPPTVVCTAYRPGKEGVSAEQDLLFIEKIDRKSTRLNSSHL